MAPRFPISFFFVALGIPFAVAMIGILTAKPKS